MTSDTTTKDPILQIQDRLIALEFVVQRLVQNHTFKSDPAEDLRRAMESADFSKEEVDGTVGRVQWLLMRGV